MFVRTGPSPPMRDHPVEDPVEGRPSGDGASKQVTVLGHGAGEDREVHLSVVVDSDDAYNSLAQAVAGQDNGTRGDPVGSPSVGESRPTEAVVVLGVQISYQVDLIGHGLLLRRSFSGFMIRVHHDVVLT